MARANRPPKSPRPPRREPHARARGRGRRPRHESYLPLRLAADPAGPQGRAGHQQHRRRPHRRNPRRLQRSGQLPRRVRFGPVRRQVGEHPWHFRHWPRRVHVPGRCVHHLLDGPRLDNASRHGHRPLAPACPCYRFRPVPGPAWLRHRDARHGREHRRGRWPGAPWLPLGPNAVANGPAVQHHPRPADGRRHLPARASRPVTRE